MIFPASRTLHVYLPALASPPRSCAVANERNHLLSCLSSYGGLGATAEQTVIPWVHCGADEKVSTELKKQIMQARLAKKLTQAQLANVGTSRSAFCASNACGDLGWCSALIVRNAERLCCCICRRLMKSRKLYRSMRAAR